MSATPLSRPLVGGLCALAFLTMLTYAIAGSATQSLFLTAYGSAMLPWVWLAVAGASGIATVALAYASRTLNIVSLFARSCLFSALSLTLLLAMHIYDVPGTPYLLYVWKDIYIIVLVELFWTFSNVAFAVSTASRAYGLFCAAGSLGSVAGNLMVGPLATKLGTAHALWLILPLLALLRWGCQSMARKVPLPEPQHRAKASLKSGVTVLRNSPYLIALAGLVATVQLMLTLTDFRFNRAIELTFTHEAERTQVIGLLGAFINGLSFIVQLLTSHILGTFGLQKTLIALPALLATALIAGLWRPGIVTTAACLTLGKTLDYSLFRAAKEMLYIPLSYAEKTQGKAFVDIFTYRIAKGCASMLLLGLGLQAGLEHLLSWFSLVLCGAWALCVVLILRRYRKVISAL